VRRRGRGSCSTTAPRRPQPPIRSARVHALEPRLRRGAPGATDANGMCSRREPRRARQPACPRAMPSNSSEARSRTDAAASARRVSRPARAAACRTTPAAHRRATCGSPPLNPRASWNARVARFDETRGATTSTYNGRPREARSTTRPRRHRFRDRGAQRRVERRNRG
jgi:hypothetical protein